MKSEFDSSAEVRGHLVRALRADLVGPFAGNDSAEEVWDLAPSKRYLYGFLVPSEQAEVENEEDEDPTEDDLLEACDDLADGGQDDPQAKRRPMLPSSIGLSVLLPPGDGDSINVTVSYADYVAEQQEPEVDAQGKKKRGRPKVHWHRAVRDPLELVVGLKPNMKKKRKTNSCPHFRATRKWGQELVLRSTTSLGSRERASSSRR